MRYILAGARHVRGLLAMLGGRPTEAYEHLAATFDVDQDRYHPINRWWLVPDLADAAVASGNTMQAQELLAGLPAMARRLPTPMVLLATSYTAAVLASEAEEDDQYLAALHGEVGGWSMYRARLQLRHASDCGAPSTVGRQGAAASGLRHVRRARARTEGRRGSCRAARATGETSPRRTLGISDQLSAQEVQIATLAADGLTNRQIAERLCPSHRTAQCCPAHSACAARPTT